MPGRFMGSRASFLPWLEPCERWGVVTKGYGKNNRGGCRGGMGEGVGLFHSLTKEAGGRGTGPFISAERDKQPGESGFLIWKRAVYLMDLRLALERSRVHYWKGWRDPEGNNLDCHNHYIMMPGMARNSADLVAENQR